jgi:hypothetical protein
MALTATVTVAPTIGTPMGSRRRSRAGQQWGVRESLVRRSTTILIGAIAVGLVAGLSVGVVAQDDEPGQASAVYATGTVGWPPAEIVEPETEQVPGGNDERGLMLVDLPVQFSDPRLSGLLTIAGNGTTRELTDGRAWIESRTFRIVNDGGEWAGSGYLVRTSSDEPAIDEQSMLLVGEDAYEGYVAYVFLDAAPDGAEEWEALILEAEQPPLPDPVATQ